MSDNDDSRYELINKDGSRTKVTEQGITSINIFSKYNAQCALRYKGDTLLSVMFPKDHILNKEMTQVNDDIVSFSYNTYFNNVLRFRVPLKDLHKVAYLTKEEFYSRMKQILEKLDEIKYKILLGE